MRVFIVLLSFMFLSGCHVYRNTPKLDHALTNAGKSIASSASISLEPTSTEIEAFHARHFFNNTKGMFVDNTANRIVIKNIHHKYPMISGKGFQCFEPMLLVLSVGLIPAFCEQESDITVEYIQPNSANPITKTISYKSEAISGWLALIYAISPNWSFQSTSSDEYAFYTLLNNMQESK